ncbi:MAG: serine acetyltransferase [Myxococcota bacterium]
MSLFKTIVADYRRHAASASHRSMPALMTYRFGVWLKDRPRPVRAVGNKVYGVALLASEVVSGIFMDSSTEVGENLHFVHAGGINIHPATRIGDRVGLMHGVTLAMGVDEAAPVIGNDVFIGANASVIGGVTVGDGARVAANSLVLSDVPPGYLAIGVPAKAVPQIASLKSKKKKAPKDGEAAPSKDADATG